jgi:SAM-dependent methyltransferase
LIVIPYIVSTSLIAFVICGVLAIICGLPFVYISFILIYSYWWFSEHGGQIQIAIHNLIIDNINKQSTKYNILDVGCGSGSLSIKIAKKCPLAQITGVDY